MRILKKKPTVNRAIILFTQHPHYLLFFCIIECSVLMALVFYHKGMLEQVTMQRTQQFSDFVTENAQLNAMYSQLLKKSIPIALAETCRFLTIQLLEFQDHLNDL